VFPIIGVLTGIGSAAGWGVGDFLAGKSSQKSGPYQAAFLSVLFGLIITAVIYLIFVRDFGIPSLDIFIRLTILVLGLSAAQILFFKALSIGPIGIVATIGSAYSLVTVPLALGLLGEHLTTGQLVAVATIILGVILTSIQIGGKSVRLISKRGVLLALGAMIIWGISFAFLDPVVESLGWVKAFSLEYVLMVIWELVILGAMGIGFRKLVAPGFNRLVVANSVAFLFGNAAFNLGLEKGLVSIVTPISSAYPVITVLLAWIFLKEHLKRNQLLGIALVITGVTILAVYG
jgi:drug/metabolite transporter (DMT)-like permease